MQSLQIGSQVSVPWGLEGSALGEVVDVWGDPPTHVRVQLRLDDDEDPVVILLSVSTIEPVPTA